MSDEVKSEELQANTEGSEEQALANKIFPESAKEDAKREADKPKSEVVEKVVEKVEEDVKEESEESEDSDKESKEEGESKEAAEIEYKLEIPENSKLDKDALERIAAYAKERGLSNDDAQEILLQESDAIDDYSAAQEEQLKQITQVDWVEQAKADKEIGGEKFKESAEFSRRALERFGTEAFSAELDRTGFGNHPELVRMFSRIGRSMDGDKLVTGSSPSAPKSMEDIFYPKQDNKEN